MKEILESVFSRGILKKLTLSKPVNKSVTKTQGKLISMKNGTYLQLESFLCDGKVIQRNIKQEDAAQSVCLMIGHEYKQLNIITSAGDCEIRVSGKGKITVIDRIKDEGEKVLVQSHDRVKKYIIPEGTPTDFLIKLGVQDAGGRVYDKKRPKFRQINRFLEMLSDVESELDAKELYILDLCCGKSYLSFAVYYYFTYIKKKTVIMDCVDLKKDVVEYCADAAKKLNYNNMRFIAGNIEDFTPARTPDLVVSLHACDIATDIVLAKAVASRAKVIMSTPCCHHEMMHQIKPQGVLTDFMPRPSILKQKFCDAATDSLRCMMLTSKGYDVHALELIDPEETPKNVLIRAIRNDSAPQEETKKAADDYKLICRTLGIEPYLEKLLNN